MRRVVILLALVVPIALIARSRGRSNPDKIADVKGGIGSLEGDRQVLAQMRKGGADLSKATEVNFYLYFKDQPTADSAAAHAGAGPLAATVRRGADPSSWLCFVTGRMVPNEAAIHAMAVRFLALAKQYGGEYDGWEAAITK
jgi:Regulator of ribonuclease activity B